MKTYLIHIQLQSRSPHELKDFVQALNKIFEQHTESHQLAYATPDKQLFAYMAQSVKPAHALRLAIDGNQAFTRDRAKKQPINTGFRNGDRIIVMELGHDISDNGFNVINTWLTLRQ